jgi:2-oxoglutarate ferredoxin oxidoreductase subunit alpha
VLEAMKHTKNKFRAVQIVWLNPIDEIKLNKILSGVKKIVAVEGNYTGQMCSALREQTGLDIKKKILKYDALPFEPRDLAKDIDMSFRPK